MNDIHAVEARQESIIEELFYCKNRLISVHAPQIDDPCRLYRRH